MRRALVAVAVVAGLAGAAGAAPRHVLVLRADGKADATTRTRVEAAVMTLARRIDGEVAQGDVTYSDATAAVGCEGEAATCGEPLLDGLAVDEIVAIGVAPVPGGEVTVTVTRISRAGAREASGTVAAADLGKPLTDAVGPLFGIARPATGATAAGTPATGTAATGAVTATTTVPAETPPVDGTTDPAAPPVTPPVAPPEPAVTAAPAGVVTAPEGHRTSRLAIATVAGGGALMIVGLVLWNQASSLQTEIADAPTRTRADLLHLQDLESSADAYALWGNVTFFGGVALAGVGGYLMWRGRHGSDHRQARIEPLLVDHGAGLSLTFGGGR